MDAPGNQVLAIYGDMDPEHIKPLLNHYWDRNQQHLEPVAPIELELSDDCPAG